MFWRYTAHLSPGSYDLEVRATDGRNEQQTDRVTDTFPQGSTGHHKIHLRVDG